MVSREPSREEKRTGSACGRTEPSLGPAQVARRDWRHYAAAIGRSQSAEAERDAAVARAERAEHALRTYGRHLNTCWSRLSEPLQAQCDCGFELTIARAALDAAKDSDA